jgi:hypothetical protein
MFLSYLERISYIWHVKYCSSHHMALFTQAVLEACCALMIITILHIYVFVYLSTTWCISIKLWNFLFCTPRSWKDNRSMQVQQGYQMPLIPCHNDGNICICICTCVVDQINTHTHTQRRTQQSYSAWWSDCNLPSLRLL